MRSWALVILILLLLGPSISAETEEGSICIATVPAKATLTAGTPDLFCESENLSLRIDSQEAMPWPIKESVLITGLDVTTRHRVVVFCGGKPQQSFFFRFSQFKTKKLCLFVNGFYKTVQLWDSKQSPWCKCKQD